MSWLHNKKRISSVSFNNNLIVLVGFHNLHCVNYYFELFFDYDLKERSLIRIFSLTSSDFGITFGTNAYFLFHIPKASAEIEALGFLSAPFLAQEVNELYQKIKKDREEEHKSEPKESDEKSSTAPPSVPAQPKKRKPSTSSSNDSVRS